MNKLQWIFIILKILGVVIALGMGIWYMSSSIGGDSLTYTSVDSFLNAIGASGGIDGVGGKFLGKYVVELLQILGTASEMFWKGIVGNLWVLMIGGFAIYMFVSAAKYLWEKMKKNAEYSDKANNMDFKTWFDPVWKVGLRVMIAGAVIGALDAGGIESLTTVSEIIIDPILYIGSALSMAATNINSATDCTTIMGANELPGAMSAVSGSFMCVLGNLYAIMLAGAAGGFALMNYAWLGLGGGVMTWVSGLLLVLGFLVIGFDLFFQIFSVLFKVVFVIIFLPILIAALAYETVWKAASGLFRKSIEIVIKAAISVISISLKIVILFSIIYFCADSMYPGPVDTYTAILPPLFEDKEVVQNASPETSAVMQAFATCEAQSKDSDGNVEASAFETCFEAQKESIQQVHPGAFEFLDAGWSFFITMLGLLLLYFYVLSPRIDKIIPAGKVNLPIFGEQTANDTGTLSEFDIGKWTRDLGEKVWHAPGKIFKGTVQRLKDNGFIR